MVTLYGSGTILLTKSVHRHYEGCTTKQVQQEKLLVSVYWLLTFISFD